jgi:hypothetical protein
MGEDSERPPKKKAPKTTDRDKRNTFRGYANKVVAKDIEPEPAQFEEERTESVHVEARVAGSPEIDAGRVARPLRRGQPTRGSCASP